jgi:NADPH:quinone reductase-like Zn-dependent oxidoreductase
VTTSSGVVKRVVATRPCRPRSSRGGVGTTLVKLARHARIRVIGTAGPGQRDRVRELGAVPLDYRGEDVPARVRELAPDGIADSWRMLGRGGTLVSYGTASTKDLPGNPRLPVLKLLLRLAVWNLPPNGRRTSFVNLWAGHRLRPDRFWAEGRDDLGQVLDLLARGEITAQVAARFPLSQAAAALTYAEAGGYIGKVIIVPARVAQRLHSAPLLRATSERLRCAA